MAHTVPLWQFAVSLVVVAVACWLSGYDVGRAQKPPRGQVGPGALVGRLRVIFRLE